MRTKTKLLAIALLLFAGISTANAQQNNNSYINNKNNTTMTTQNEKTTAILKAAFDRLFAVAEKDPNLRNPRKDAVLLMASEGDTEANFKPVIDYYHALLSHLGWKNLGEVNCGGVFNVGDINGHPKLADCYRLGLSVGRE